MGKKIRRLTINDNTTSGLGLIHVSHLKAGGTSFIGQKNVNIHSDSQAVMTLQQSQEKDSQLPNDDSSQTIEIIVGALLVIM